MTQITTIIATLSLVAFVGCSKKESSPEAEATPKAEVAAAPSDEAVETAAAEPEVAIGECTPDQLESWMKEQAVAIYDANGEKTREEFGKIPTATLLPASSDYDVSVLPESKDTKLVFYCSNTMCGASKKSAKVAVAAGYTDVNVLPVGVKGWKEAGKTTESI